jgi:Flp pilus assembly protein TadG
MFRCSQIPKSTQAGLRTAFPRRSPGQAMIEGALGFAVFFAALCGLVEFSQAVWAYTLVAHAAREATRYASVHGENSSAPATQDKITSIVQRQTLGLSNVTGTLSWVPDKKVGSSVKVVVTYNFSFFGPWIPVGTIPLTSTSQMVISN